MNGSLKRLGPQASLAALRRPWLPPVLVTVVCVLGFGLAPGRLPLQGEETRRMLHGMEMADTGNWLVATIQGVRIIDRPPLHYWTLAGIHRWIHPLDHLTVRLVMLVITLATSLLVWWYASRFLSAPAALLAGAAYPTLGHVLDLGRRIETDAQFALLCSASLLVWHEGYASGRGRYRTWIIAGILAALASLTKGLQGPITFFGAIGFFLLLVRDWRWLLHASSVLGAVSFLLTIAVWQVPFFAEVGWSGLVLAWFHPATSRIDGGLFSQLQYMATFPVNVVAATLPWSPLLAILFLRRFWVLEERVKSSVVFLLCGGAAVFVPVWLSPGGTPRYVMPMYPLVAVLCGAVVHRCLSEGVDDALRRYWSRYMGVLAICVVAVTLGFFVITLLASWAPGDGAEGMRVLAQPLWQITAVLILMVPMSLFVIRGAGRAGRGNALSVSFLVCAMLALAYNGPVINALSRNAVDIHSEVARLRDEVPEDAPLVSIGPIHHRFLYAYGKPLRIVQRPWYAHQVPKDMTYFVIDSHRGASLELPFSWTELARLNMDRNHSDDPEDFVIVGRRTPPI